MVCPLQGISLQLQVWRHGWQRAGWGQEGSYRPLPPPPPPLGDNSYLCICPPPLWPPLPGSFTSLGTGRSTNEIQRERLWCWLLHKLGGFHFAREARYLSEGSDTTRAHSSPSPEGVWSCSVLVERVDPSPVNRLGDGLSDKTRVTD